MEWHSPYLVFCDDVHDINIHTYIYICIYRHVWSGTHPILSSVMMWMTSITLHMYVCMYGYVRIHDVNDVYHTAYVFMYVCMHGYVRIHDVNDVYHTAYVAICVCVCVCVYVWIHIWRLAQHIHKMCLCMYTNKLYVCIQQDVCMYACTQDSCMYVCIHAINDETSLLGWRVCMYVCMHACYQSGAIYKDDVCVRVMCASLCVYDHTRTGTHISHTHLYKYAKKQIP